MSICTSIGNRLVCDVTRLRKRMLSNQRLTGIDRVTTEYLKWVLSNNGSACLQLKNQLVLISLSSVVRFLQIAESVWCSQDVSSRKMLYLQLPVLLRGHFFTSRKSLSHKIIINTSHSWLSNQQVWRNIRNALNVNTVVFIHDLIPVTHPEYSTTRSTYEHFFRLRNALEKSNLIIVNSHETSIQLMKYAHDNNLPVPRLITAPLAVSEYYDLSQNIIQSENCYFVILGTIEPRKNLSMVLEVWKKLINKMGSSAPYLYIIGKRGWHS